MHTHTYIHKINIHGSFSNAERSHALRAIFSFKIFDFLNDNFVFFVLLYCFVYQKWYEASRKFSFNLKINLKIHFWNALRKP